ncbi:MAG: hypothetical protein GXP55_11165 [Deltaproteobacteria bacterium]|nr:hypothetical protein [Deltaproteobacteria bacterium]
MNRLLVLAYLVLLVPALPACSSDLTQLVVVVDTDMAIPDDIDMVRVDVRGPSGESASEQQDLGAGASLPLTLGVRPASSALGPIRVSAVGLRNGLEVVRQTAIVSLVRGETRMLRLMLSADCAGAACSGGRTCVRGACSDQPTQTEPWSGEPPPRDAGAGADSSAGLDSGLDASLDSGLDAGDCIDLGCDDGNECTDDLCTSRGCEHAPNASPCDDGVFCNGFDVCADGACQPGADDPCPPPTTCDEASRVCLGCRSDSDCGDANPCTNDLCVDGSCMYPDNTNACDDGDPCSVGDACAGGSCQPGPRLECNDGNRYTVDSCVGGSCVNTCATCTSEGSCAAGTASTACGTGGGVCRNCNDGNECTIDSCGGAACSNLNRVAGAPCVGGVCLAGDCVECRRDADCADPRAARCDTTIHRCKPCSTGAECAHLGSRRICDRSGSLVSGRCITSCLAGCLDFSSLACLPGTSDISCGTNGIRCVDCTSSGDTCASGRCAPF